MGRCEGRRTVLGEYTHIGLNEKEILDFLDRSKPDVVGITSNFTAHHGETLEIASIAKKYDPGIKVIFGGMHATMDYMDTIKHPAVDIVVRGDGEKILLALLDAMERKEDYSRMAGTVVKKNGEIIVNQIAPPIEDLDSLPVPAYDMLHMDYYLGLNNSRVERFFEEPIGIVLSSRGCPFNCIFCATDKLFKKFRPRSAKNVVDEIEYLVRKYGAKEIAFQDDCFLASRSRVKEICEEIIKRKLNIRWSVPPGMNAWLLDVNLLKLMKKSGLYRVIIPVETASPETLKFIRKSVNLENTREIVKQCNKLGIRTSGNFMIGFPYETAKNIQETVDYILNTDFDVVSVLICQPLKGSDLYELCKKEGIVQGDPKTGSVPMCTLYDTKYFSAKELNRMRQDILEKFFKKRLHSLFTPRGFYYHIFCKACSFRNIVYALKIIMKNVFISRVGVLDILKAK
jgi:radical SAM superfamily enzyme YgiQ (UPF0313 family)